MSNPNNNDDEFKDPKIAYLFTLNNDLESIYKDLIDSPYRAACKMVVFIQRLKVPEQFTEMADIKKRWRPETVGRTVGYGKYHSGGLKNDEIWNIWSILSDFMSNSYFLGYEKGGKPQFGMPGHKL